MGGLSALARTVHSPRTTRSLRSPYAHPRVSLPDCLPSVPRRRSKETGGGEAGRIDACCVEFSLRATCPIAVFFSPFPPFPPSHSPLLLLSPSSPLPFAHRCAVFPPSSPRICDFCQCRFSLLNSGITISEPKHLPNPATDAPSPRSRCGRDRGFSSTTSWPPPPPFISTPAAWSKAAPRKPCTDDNQLNGRSPATMPVCMLLHLVGYGLSSQALSLVFRHIGWLGGSGTVSRWGFVIQGIRSPRFTDAGGRP